MEYRSSDADIVVVIVLIVLVLGAGTIAFSYLEGWSIIDSLYFSVSTITTIGYGDLVPTNDISKLVMIGYGLVGISILLFTVSKLMVREESLVEKLSDHLVRKQKESMTRIEQRVDEQVEQQVEDVKKEVKKHVEQEVKDVKKEVKEHVEKEVKKQIEGN